MESRGGKEHKRLMWLHSRNISLSPRSNVSRSNWLDPWKPLGHATQLTSLFFFSLICVRVFLFDCSLSALKFIYKPPNCLILRPVSMLLLVNFRLKEKWSLKTQVTTSKWKQLKTILKSIFSSLPFFCQWQKKSLF